MYRSKAVASVPFATKRFINHSVHRYYYAFGNTPAEDLLEHVPDDIESPSVLQLGCGDIRSCLYTIWKNFDEHCGHGNFKGVTFHLNDYCAAVLARNVLFLHLIKKLSDIPSQLNSLEVKKMVCAIWNIWFCHDLQQSQVALLKESLLELLTFFRDPESWSKSSNQLRHIVGFFEQLKDDTLQEINSVFKMWLEMLKFSSSKVQNLKRQKSQYAEKAQKVPLLATFEMYLFQATQNISDSAKKFKMRCLIAQEITSYIETGNAHPEALFGLRAEYVKANSFLNPTLYEKEDQYTLHYLSVPYECFTHSLPMTTTNITFPEETLIVDQKCFVNTPLHANSLQQFTLWLVSTAKYLAQASSQQISLNEPKISFLLNFSDAIAAAVELSYKDGLLFDVIHASNLVDNLSSLAVIVSSIPLLKSTGVLLTSTFLYGNEKSLCEFLKMTFGFKMEYLGMFGIRCIGHEGVYTGDGVLCPTPAFQMSLEQSLKDILPRSLIWISLANTPQCLPLLERDSAITHALYSCIKSSASCIFRKGLSTISAVGACTQSSMKMIYLFLRQLSSDSPVDDFHFWEGLCYYLQQDPQLKPFLMHLQSQAVLMNIHMHITVDETDCPLCNAIPMKQYFRRFQVEFKPNFSQEVKSSSSTIALICFHPKMIDLSRLDLMDLPSNVFLLDSSPTFLIHSNTKMLVDIVIPRYAVYTAEYSFSVYFHNFYQLTDYFLGHVASTVPLKKAKAIDLDYKARSLNSLQPNPSSSFGKLILLEYVGNVYNINISLSEEVLSNLMEKNPLTSEKISNTEIKISCKNLSLPLKFNMPVDYNELSIKYSKKRKLVMIEAPCKPFQSEDHLLLYFSTPHNNVALPEVSFESYETTFGQAAETQLTSVQKTTSANPLLTNVEKVFALMFQSQKSAFFLTTKKPNKLFYGLIKVHKRCLDVQNHTVALDLSYCIKKDGTINREMYSANLGNPCEIEVDKDELDFIENVLCLFYRRTRKSSKIPCPPVMAGCPMITDVPNGGHDGFRRALVYHLSSSNVYNDDFERKLDPPSFTRFETTTKSVKCSYCQANVNKVLRCSICLNTAYCGVGCQLKDADQHYRTQCKPSESHGTVASSSQKPRHQDAETVVCFFCEEELEKILKCGKCFAAMYCSKECQIKDWPNHKRSCKKSDAARTT